MAKGEKEALLALGGGHAVRALPIYQQGPSSFANVLRPVSAEFAAPNAGTEQREITLSSGTKSSGYSLLPFVVDIDALHLCAAYFVLCTSSSFKTATPQTKLIAEDVRLLVRI